MSSCFQIEWIYNVFGVKSGDKTEDIYGYEKNKKRVKYAFVNFGHHHSIFHKKCLRSMVLKYKMKL